MITAAIIALFKLPGQLWQMLVSLFYTVKDALISFFKIIKSLIEKLLKVPGMIINFITSTYKKIKELFEMLFVPKDKKKRKNDK